MIVIYILVILLATISGAVAGLGGGVIIKPVLDMLGYHNASTIGFYSSLAVFTMSIVSIYKQLKNGFRFETKTVVLIAIGSILGGIAGENIFNLTTASLSNHLVKAIQASLLLITLILIIIYSLNKNKINHYQIKNAIVIFFVGLGLGAISIFLGIGGGPLNVALLMLLFSYPMKEATIYSVATIFFSQLSKLGTICLSGQLLSFDLKFVPAIIITAILGGYIGTCINQKMKNKQIHQVYNYLIVILMIISTYNILTNLIV